ncbi:MAG: DUF4421 family protein [Bacteroidota bacterium]
MFLRRSALLIVLLCSLYQQSLCQEDSLRNKYVKSFHDYFFLGPVLKKRNMAFDISSIREPDKRLTFKPNSSYSIGLSLNIFEIGLEASLSVPINIKNQEKYGTSTASDFRINTISRRWMLEAYHQKYSGFYFSNPSLILPADQSYPHRDDLQTRNFGLSLSYLFNSDKFSLRSAYTFTERQQKSRGSFLFSYIISSFNLEGDSALIKQSEWSTFGAGSSAYQMKFTSLGIGPGYSYNLVYRDFFLNLTLILGPAHYWIRYTEEAGPVRYDIRISTFQSARIGVGYNGDRFFGGLSLTNQARNLRFEQVAFSNEISTFRFMVGYRFKEKGILQRRAIDYAPAKRK